MLQESRDPVRRGVLKAAPNCLGRHKIVVAERIEVAHQTIEVVIIAMVCSVRGCFARTIFGLFDESGVRIKF